MKSALKKIIVWLLTLEARVVLKKYKPKIVAITGSVGKTTTKDMVYAALTEQYHVRKSEKSFNSELGVPLTILGLPNAWNNPFAWIENVLDGLAQCVFSREYPKWLVLEVGLDAPGDIARVAKWLRADVVVFTRFPDVPVHVEFFANPEAVIAEKKKLLNALKDDGVLIVNEDDAKMRDMQITAQQKKLSFGFGAGAHVRAESFEMQKTREKPSGMRFRLTVQGSSQPVVLPGVIGLQSVYAALAALSVCVSQKMNIVVAASALSRLVPTPGRMRLVSGIHNSVLIDDTYNASPIAVESALQTLADLQGARRKIAVLGDMLELGSFSSAAHKKVGEQAISVVDILVCVGVRMKGTGDAALQSGFAKENVLFFQNSQEAGEALRALINDGDVVLIKGSQSARMERVTEALLENPEQAKELLVRQDEEWKRKA